LASDGRGLLEMMKNKGEMTIGLVFIEEKMMDQFV
jgi:hypothetical protein